MVVLPGALPVPQPSPWQIRSGERVDHPSSADVAVGRKVPFRIYTHCGFDFRIDFDGSSGRRTPTMRTPRRTGSSTER